MPVEYYSLPILFGDLIQKKNHSKCSLIQSVAQNLHLMLITRFGENRSNLTYGCGIWDDEFEILISKNEIEQNIHDSLKKSIGLYEKRITNVSISVELKQEQIGFNIGEKVRIKRKVEISITGNLVMTNETCSFKDSFFIGPISFQ